MSVVNTVPAAIFTTLNFLISEENEVFSIHLQLPYNKLTELGFLLEAPSSDEKTTAPFPTAATTVFYDAQTASADAAELDSSSYPGGRTETAADVSPSSFGLVQLVSSSLTLRTNKLGCLYSSSLSSLA
jgi:hypothetical protein